MDDEKEIFKQESQKLVISLEEEYERSLGELRRMIREKEMQIKTDRKDKLALRLRYQEKIARAKTEIEEIKEHIEGQKHKTETNYKSMDGVKQERDQIMRQHRVFGEEFDLVKSEHFRLWTEREELLDAISKLEKSLYGKRKP